VPGRLHRTVAADGTPLAWRRAGDPAGPPVVLLQGFGVPGYGWATVLAALARRYDCLLPDLRAVGRSGGPGGPLTGAQLADDALRVLDDAGVPRAHVVGNSLGGAVAQTLTTGAPERVRSLSLLASTCGHVDWRDALFARVEELGAAGPKGAVAATMAPFARRRGGSRAGDVLAATGARLGHAGLRSSAEGLGALAHVVLSQPPELCDRLATTVARRGLPVLVLAGAWDRLAPREETRPLAARLGARYVELAAGHLLSGTPSAARTVRDFLDDVEDGRA
jgi:pimeloyl-ACP methyl ester carboxylesterase